MDGSTLQWTEEILISVERMAGAAFSLNEIAEVLEVDAEDLKSLMHSESPFSKRYRKGYLMRELELRERIFKDAKNGSSPAQAQALKLLEQLKMSNYL